MTIVILGLSITSSWGNGHATTYRGLVRELAARGHRVTFLERDVPWYADNRDVLSVDNVQIVLYKSVAELKDRYASLVRGADVVIVGSYVPDGVPVGEWVTRVAQGVTAFYDIDTPVTLAKLRRGDFEYLTPELISRYQLYLSFTGGPTLRYLEKTLGSPRARPLYCSFDPRSYYPETLPETWGIGYLGTYSVDRQPGLQRLLLDPARKLPAVKFVVAGPQYPAMAWPTNVERIEHLPPAQHRHFYNRQRFTLNLTRADMKAAGYSPSVRLFEAAACATPIISDDWEGIDTFFKPDRALLVARSKRDVLRFVREMSDADRRAIGENARREVLAKHTAAHRARELEAYMLEASHSLATASRVGRNVDTKKPAAISGVSKSLSPVAS